MQSLLFAVGITGVQTFLALFFSLKLLDTICGRKIFRHCSAKLPYSLAHFSSNLFMGPVGIFLSFYTFTAELVLSLSSTE